jgi:hypothetical protein
MIDVRFVVAAVLLATSFGAAAHDPYTEWRQPTGASCCSGRDCKAMQACTTPDGSIGAVLNGTCFALPPDRRVPAPVDVWQSSSEALHVCAAPIYLDGRVTALHVYCWDYAIGS